MADIEQISAINDKLRKGVALVCIRGQTRAVFPKVEGIKAKLLLNCNVEAVKVPRIIDAVNTYDSFEEGNDPYGERDFGKVEVDGEKYFFKFDYVDDNWEFHKVNGNRVLTIYPTREH